MWLFHFTNINKNKERWTWARAVSLNRKEIRGHSDLWRNPVCSSLLTVFPCSQLSLPPKPQLHRTKVSWEGKSQERLHFPVADSQLQEDRTGLRGPPEPCSWFYHAPQLLEADACSSTPLKVFPAAWTCLHCWTLPKQEQCALKRSFERRSQTDAGSNPSSILYLALEQTT